MDNPLPVAKQTVIYLKETTEYLVFYLGAISKTVNLNYCLAKIRCSLSNQSAFASFRKLL